jgi:hypothetical protein
MSRAALTEQVVIQKEYRVSEAMGGESPEAFAAGMSAAMAEASAKIIADVNSAIGRQLTKEGS